MVPLLFENPADYDEIDQMDELEIEHFPEQLKSKEVVVKNVTKGTVFKTVLDVTDSEQEAVLCGGQLRYLKHQLKQETAIQ